VAQYSMTTSTVQRSAGSSAVAHAAYISGGRLVDERTGAEADYTRREGVECVASEIVVPDDERGAKFEREALWNMAEAAEKRRDGTPARKVLVALPHELGQAERLAMTQEYAKWIANRYHVAVDFAVHQPDKEGDQRNYHAHMLVTTREVRDGQLADKAQLEWNGSRLKKEGLPSGKAMVHELRERWETIQNEYLKEHAPDVERVSCKRLAVQREAKLQEADRLTKEGREPEATEARLKAVELDRPAQRHVGFAANEMERREIPTERGELRRLAQQEHAERLGMVAQIRERMTRALEATKERIERGMAAIEAKFQKHQSMQEKFAKWEKQQQQEKQKQQPEQEHENYRGR
jgi:hypothetical protein